MIKIFNVSKSYNQKTRDGKANAYAAVPVNEVLAVDNLSMTVNAGEIFGFLGPNGAGKTTTIKMITGILPFSQGKILVNNFDVRVQPVEAKRSIGFVPDNHIIYEKLTGKEYINFMADMYSVDTSIRKTRADYFLEKFNLAKDVDSQISSYSHGMKQKISVIGALIHNPKVWILDEPLTGLDPQSAYELKNLMKEHTKQGNVVFFSTHVLEVAEKLCDRIGIINKGRLVKVGTMQDIKEAGKDESLEDFFIKITGGKTELINSQNESK